MLSRQFSLEAGNDVLINWTQLLTHTLVGFVKLGTGGFNITIGEIVEFVVPQEFDIFKVAVILALGQLLVLYIWGTG